MFACLHRKEGGLEGLLALARAFSPSVEITDERTVVFSITGLGRLIGGPDQIASEVARRGAEAGIMANLAIAADPDTAILAARCLSGVHCIPPGKEALWLGRIPLSRVPMPEELHETLSRWGLRNLEDVAALPAIGLAERLGEAGVRLYRTATGAHSRPLNLAPPETSYRENLELEDPVSNLEPLLFLIARILNELCRRLAAQFQAANRITTELTLEDGAAYRRTLELPAPLTDSKQLLKLIQLDLEAHPPRAAVTAVGLHLQPVRPRSIQSDLFLPPAPAPDKLQLTLARLEGIAGRGNVGSPAVLDTHRPDAVVMRPFHPPEGPSAGTTAPTLPPALVVLRWYRPPLPAEVRTHNEAPHSLRANGIRGEVTEAAGPWRTSGEWWTDTPWARDEWDLSLTDGGVYRVFLTLDARAWFVQGVYD